MVIVSIIMIMAALAAPGMMRAMAINRAQRATMDVARVGRAGRSDAIAFGRAYMLVHSPGAAGRGRVQLWRGLTDTCRTTDWAAVISTPNCADSPDCVDEVDMDTYSTASSWVTLTTPGPTRLCFEPDAELWVPDGGAFMQPVQSIRLGLQRFDGATGGTPLEQRGVVFPITGAPRTER